MKKEQKLERFTLYEVQEVTEWRVFRYELRAQNLKDAIDRIQAGEARPIDEGTCGESDFGTSAFGRNRVEAIEQLDIKLARNARSS